MWGGGFGSGWSFGPAVSAPRIGTIGNEPPVPPPRTGGSGTFAAGAEIKVPPEAALVVTFQAGATHTVQGRYRSGGGLGNAQNASCVFSGALFEGILPSGADADIAWDVVPDTGTDPFLGGGIFNGVVTTNYIQFNSLGTVPAPNAGGSLQSQTYSTETVLGLTLPQPAGSIPAGSFQIQTYAQTVFDGLTDYGSGNVYRQISCGGNKAIDFYVGGPPGTGTNILDLYIGYVQIRGSAAFQLAAGSLITLYNGVSTAGGGILYELYTTGTTSVQLGTSSTSILSSGSGIASGLYKVTVNVISVAAAITGTLTVTYVDNTTGGSATQSITVAALGSGAAASYEFLCNAKTGTAIAVAGTASTANDLKATAAIFAL